MKEKWVVSAKKADFYAIAKQFGIDPVIARIIRNRDIIGEEAIRQYLYGGPELLHDPFLMHNMEHAASFLVRAIEQKQPIRIIGDYDIDGVMSSYILLSSLEILGADVDVRIPHRITDGYGLNANLVKEAHEDGRQIIITCDNGIAAKAEIDMANALGMRVIVTDHHEIPLIETNGGMEEQLPVCEAVLNPKQKACNYPFKGLCGAGVAYKLMQALFHKMTTTKEQEQHLDELLGMVAFATIGDVMDLTGENRILVKEGLKRLHSVKNPGLRALILQNNLEAEAIDVYHIGFILGPCLNAGGRLETAKRSLKLLCAQTREEAEKLAGDLIALNASRKSLTADGAKEAIRIIETTEMKKDPVLVIYLEQCHESIAGIIAGRVKEHFHKPTIVLTDTEEGIKGSGRSIEAYDMFSELSACKALFTKFGGHKMAAGLSMEKKNLELFRRQINAACTLTEEDLTPKITIDVPMPISYVRYSLIEQFSLLAPFGKGNEKPVFAEADLKVLHPVILGKNRNVVKMELENRAGFQAEGIYFGEGDVFLAYIKEHETISIIYAPVIHSYRGKTSVQIRISAYR